MPIIKKISTSAMFPFAKSGKTNKKEVIYKANQKRHADIKHNF